MPDDDQVGADLFRIVGDLLDGIPDENFAARGVAPLGKPLQAIGKDFLIPQPLRFRVRPAVVQNPVDGDVDR